MVDSAGHIILVGKLCLAMDLSLLSILVDYVPRRKSRGTYYFWCGSCGCQHWIGRDSFLVARYFVNKWVNWNQSCMEITLEHDEDLVRFW